MPTQESISVKRGSTMALVFTIPDTIDDKYFMTWIPKAQLRKSRNDSKEGLIADLACYWVDETYKQIVVMHNMTKNWPLGRAELDIAFLSSEGYTLYSSTVEVNIEREITK